jgi:hypothetical protein
MPELQLWILRLALRQSPPFRPAGGRTALARDVCHPVTGEECGDLSLKFLKTLAKAAHLR